MTSTSWNARVRDYQRGQVVAGEVVNLEDYGAFVELEPGLTGLLHVSEIPGADYDNIRQLLWVGDHVEICIKEIDTQKRRVGLSIIERLRLRRKNRPSQPTHRRPHWATSVKTTEKRRDAPSVFSDPLSSRRIKRILVVDDDEEFAHDFAIWLRAMGYEVVGVHSSKGALDANLPSFDFVFLDGDLPGKSGFKIVGDLYAGHPELEVVLVTGRGWSDRDAEIPEDLEVANLLLKPVDYEAVKWLLSEAEEGPLPRSHPDIQTLSETDHMFLTTNSPADASESAGIDVEDLLWRLKKGTKADIAVLMSVNSLTREIGIEHSLGFNIKNEGSELLQSAFLGIVRDVALKGHTALEGFASNVRKFERLLSVVFFESCIALRVPVTMSDSRYVLFLLSRDRAAFTQRHFEQAKLVATQLALILQRDMMTSKFMRIQEFLLVGQLASSLLHELRNKFNRIETQAQLLDLDCEQLGKESSLTHMRRRSGDMQRRIDEITSTNKDLRNLMHQYLGLVGKDEFQQIDINKLLRSILKQIAPEAREGRIQIAARLDIPHLQVKTLVLRLEQVLLNVMLNAVQLMTQEKKGGRLEVRADLDSEDEDLPLKIRVTDEGPGVHAQQWDWIFRMGTTTRENGTGLGLFVSKSLMESIGGRIAIEESYIFVGTTFLIELPTLSPVEVAHD
jgi:signal transduction histidine kinase/predicted RNA-binding protein with RPS1 domain/ActR/RegA family two-component response regulator